MMFRMNTNVQYLFDLLQILKVTWDTQSRQDSNDTVRVYKHKMYEYTCIILELKIFYEYYRTVHGNNRVRMQNILNQTLHQVHERV